MNILLNEESKQQIDQFIAHPGHALGIFSPNGSGKFYAAHYIAVSILGSTEIENNPNLYIVRPEEKPSITIEQVREIITFLKLKKNSKNTIGRIIIIDNAAMLTVEAQNALLKMLEEPPHDALIIMTAPSPASLLPTVVSRLKTITLKPISQLEVIDFLSTQYSMEDIKKAWAISNGRIGLTTALLANTEHELVAAIDEAKKFLGKSQYERLLLVDQIIKQDVNQFLEALQLVSDAAFKQTAKNNNAQTWRWHATQKATAETTDSIRHNAQTKLAITNLILNI